LQLQYFGGGGAGYPDLRGIWMTAGLLLDEDDAVDQNVEEEEDLRRGGVGAERDGRATPPWRGASLL
jgi:hypothetical protein